MNDRANQPAANTVFTPGEHGTPDAGGAQRSYMTANYPAEAALATTLLSKLLTPAQTLDVPFRRLEDESATAV